MPRTSKTSEKKARHDPLLVQLKEDELHAKYGRVSQPGKRQKLKNRADGSDDLAEETFLDPKTSKRIFELARDQQEELAEEEEEEVDTRMRDEFTIPRSRDGIDDEDVSDDDSGVDVDQDQDEIFQIDSGDLKTLDTLLPPNSGERKTLADLIFSKLEGGESPAVQKSKLDREHPDPAQGLDPKVVEAYAKVGFLLQKYRSGPLPKIFKVIPSLPAWSRILALTRPEAWSPHACRAATRIFIPTMKPQQAQLFLEVVVLNAIRSDTSQNKKLNPQYYECLKKALFRPSAFFKGLIFPMLDNGCTLREAVIVASIIAKKKVPVLHSAAALMRIAEMDYSGPNSLFIRVLIDKKHQLPYKVVDALVFHFIRLSNTYKARNRGETEKLPVLWHQSLLAFCQRYSADLTPDQKDALLDVVRATPHAQIGPEIRRELVNSGSRGGPRPEMDVEMS